MNYLELENLEIKDFEKIYLIFGKENQMLKTIEELAELQFEISKSLQGLKNEEKLIEELADVFVMLKQIQLMHNISDKELSYIMRAKIERTHLRLEK